jgi:hypothetical protein
MPQNRASSHSCPASKSLPFPDFDIPRVLSINTTLFKIKLPNFDHQAEVAMPFSFSAALKNQAGASSETKAEFTFPLKAPALNQRQPNTIPRHQACPTTIPFPGRPRVLYQDRNRVTFTQLPLHPPLSAPRLPYKPLRNRAPQRAPAT